MKKIILTTMCISTLVMVTLVGCGNKTESVNTVDNIVETVTEVAETVVEETEAPHEHVFTETITKEATCLEMGEKTLTCECGESSVEEVPATGHDFSNYVSNEDATYTADGTETATCACGETDTRVAEGSMLTYTFEDMDATKYAKSTVNVRSLPNSDGEKLGGLSTNDEVKVTGKCAETGWYRIEYADGIAYISNDYLVDEKVEVQASAPVQTNNKTETKSDMTYDEVLAYASSKYPMYQIIDNGDGTLAIYDIVSHGPAFPDYAQDAFEIKLNAMLAGGYSGSTGIMDRGGHVETLNGQWSIRKQVFVWK